MFKKLKNLTIKERIEMFGIILSLIISGVALIIANDSRNISKEELQLAIKEYNSELNLVLIPEIDKSNNEFLLKPSNDEVNIQEIVIIYPQEISSKEWRLTSQNDKHSYDFVKSKIEKYINGQNIASINYKQIYLLPVKINSTYIVNGEVHNNSSIYFLEYDLASNDKSKITADILNLIYSHNLDDPNSIQCYMDYSEWTLEEQFEIESEK